MAQWGRHLVAAGTISDAQLAKAERTAELENIPLQQALISRLRLVTSKQVAVAIAKEADLPYIDLSERVIPVELVRSVPRELIEKHRVLPIEMSGDTITIATDDPTNFAAIEEIQFFTGRQINTNIVDGESLEAEIFQFFGALDGNVDDPIISQFTEKQKAEKRRQEKRKRADYRHSDPSQPSIDPKVVRARKLESLMPALLPLLIDKGIVTEAELEEKLRELRGRL
jgi:type IV pilus assembly protein PilB